MLPGVADTQHGTSQMLTCEACDRPVQFSYSVAPDTAMTLHLVYGCEATG